MLRSILRTALAAGARRVLICADFAYGYPRGFASLLPAGEDGTPPWRVVWQYLQTYLRDDLDTRAGRQPTNRSDRFEMANAINAAVSTLAQGPFWCAPEAGKYSAIPQNKPEQPFRASGMSISSVRLTDERADSDTVFRLFGTGSVGSQALTGIPRVARLRFGPEFAACSRVWPFETGWAPAGGVWLDSDVRVLHAEIYPSVLGALDDDVKDRGQVRAMWHWARDLDAEDCLLRAFTLPVGLEAGSPDEVAARTEEGWILGCPHPNQSTTPSR
jgi:hypothetical protein